MKPSSSSLQAISMKQSLEVCNRRRKSVFKVNPWLPTQPFARRTNVRLALRGVFVGQGLEGQLRRRARHVYHLLGRFRDPEFSGVAEVDRRDELVALIDAWKIFASVRLATKPSMLMAPCTDVLVVWTGSNW